MTAPAQKTNQVICDWSTVDVSCEPCRRDTATSLARISRPVSAARWYLVSYQSVAWSIFLNLLRSTLANYLGGHALRQTNRQHLAAKPGEKSGLWKAST